MTLRRRSIVSALLAVACLHSTGALGQVPPEPDLYRLDDYRAPTPLTVSGREGVDTDEARRLWEAGAAIFIDVLPAPRRPEGLPAGAVWAPRPRRGIPGSVWLPDLGRGALGDVLATWFRERLELLSGGDHTKQMVFYCLADCWMSWNATKRALEWGFSDALWYREGTDEWAAAGLPLAEETPPADMPQ
jgi:PQQ-dependent catabolism-associated CXXCW motif protein